MVAPLAAQQPVSTPALLERLDRDGGRVIVGLRPAGGRGMKQPGVRALSVAEASRIAADLQSLGFTPKHQFRIITAVSGTIAPGTLRALRAHPNVEYVQPDYQNVLDAPVRAPAVFTETVPWGIDKIQAPLAWAASTPAHYGEGVKVATLDTGGDSLQEDLVYAGGYDAVIGSASPADWADNVAACFGHGTHVAGTIAARRDNGLGVVGVAPGASLYAIQMFEDVGGDCLGYTSVELAGFDWAIANGIQVINMSFGKSYYDEAEHQGIQAAVAAGIVLVASAGNSGGGPVGYPAANPEVIAVSATDSADFLAGFSSVGPEVDVAAPGVGVYSTLPGNTYDWYSGTSMASPHVTGLAVLLRSLNPSLTVSQVREYITGWALDLGSPGVDDEYGFGRIDALASVNAVLGPPPPTLLITQQPDGAVFGEPLTQQPIVQLADANGVPVAQAGVRVSANVLSGGGYLSGQSVQGSRTASRAGTKTAAHLSQVQAVSVLTDQNGVATFTSLAITGAGTHVLEFSAPGHVPVRSQEFDVSLPQAIPLTNGVAVTGIAGDWGSQKYFVLTVPPEATSLSFTTQDGWGDVDLYVRFGTIPDFYVWDCRSWSFTTSEYCSWTGPAGSLAGDWYVMLHGYDAYGDVSLRGQWGSSQPAAALALVQQPVGAPAREMLRTQPVVQLYDAAQQPVAQAGVTVTVDANRPGILGDITPPYLIAVTDAQGRATFDGLLITEQGTHTLIFTAPSLSTATSQSVVVSLPLPAANLIAAELIGGTQVSPDDEAYLDAVGNADGVFNLGDVMAYLDRHGLAGSAVTATSARKPSGARRRP